MGRVSRHTHTDEILLQHQTLQDVCHSTRTWRLRVLPREFRIRFRSASSSSLSSSSIRTQNSSAKSKTRNFAKFCHFCKQRACQSATFVKFLTLIFIEKQEKRSLICNLDTTSFRLESGFALIWRASSIGSFRELKLWVVAASDVQQTLVAVSDAI